MTPSLEAQQKAPSDDPKDGVSPEAPAANQISLLKVIEAIEGHVDSALEVGDGLTQNPQHKLREALDQVTQTTRRQLESNSLSQLL